MSDPVKRSGPGRPPLAPQDALGRVVKVRVTEAEGEAWDAIATARGVPLSAVVRDEMARAIARERRKG